LPMLSTCASASLRIVGLVEKHIRKHKVKEQGGGNGVRFGLSPRFLWDDLGQTLSTRHKMVYNSLEVCVV
jgi:hypothetical protein